MRGPRGLVACGPERRKNSSSRRRGVEAIMDAPHASHVQLAIAKTIERCDP
jgi:hypothetical protein